MTPFVMASAVGAAWVAVISVSITPAQAALEAKSSSSSSLSPVTLSAACALPTLNHTLLGLSDVNVRMVDAADPAACCSACHAPDCMSWSWTGDLWTPHTPCHLSPFAPINSRPLVNHSGGSAPNAPPAPPAPPGPGPSPDPAGPGTYRVDLSPAGKRQTIWGVGFEIQSDSIGSGNNGMPGDGKLVCRVRVLACTRNVACKRGGSNTCGPSGYTALSALSLPMLIHAPAIIVPCLSVLYMCVVDATHVWWRAHARVHAHRGHAVLLSLRFSIATLSLRSPTRTPPQHPHRMTSRLQSVYASQPRC